MATILATKAWLAGVQTARRSPWTRPVLRALTLGLLLLVAGDRGALMATNCGIDPLEILKSQVKHNVLIFFDTSGSMNWPPTIPPGRDNHSVSADDPESRMWQAKQATKDVVQDYTGRINFGILTFPNSNALKPLNSTAAVSVTGPSSTPPTTRTPGSSTGTPTGTTWRARSPRPSRWPRTRT